MKCWHISQEKFAHGYPPVHTSWVLLCSSQNNTSFWKAMKSTACGNFLQWNVAMLLMWIGEFLCG
jgi:hypothetical protein